MSVIHFNLVRHDDGSFLHTEVKADTVLVTYGEPTHENSSVEHEFAMSREDWESFTGIGDLLARYDSVCKELRDVRG